MRDGVHLNGTLYTPKSAELSPCVVLMTPYISDNYHQRGVYFAENGLAFLIVDVRGRGNSEGCFQPFLQEAHDGHDVIEWAALQPFCNGKIGMWGGSYSGHAQWAAAKEFPPHLCTIVPAAAPFVGFDFPMRSNIFYGYAAQWLIYTGGRTGQVNTCADKSIWADLFRAWEREGTAFRDLDLMYGDRLAPFQEWLSHPHKDAYWDAYNPSNDVYQKLDIPILTITGTYDDNQPGALEHYRRQTEAQRLRAEAAEHYLVIGPWDHAGTRTGEIRIGGVTFEEEAWIDIQQLHLEWYRWTLQGGSKPEFLKKKIVYFVAGAGQWRAVDTLDDFGTTLDCRFLASRGYAGDPYHSGYLVPDAPSGQGDGDVYTFDPSSVTDAQIEAQIRLGSGSLIDQSMVHALVDKQLVYHTGAFEHDTEVSGFFELEAWLSISCLDTDIYASVHEVTSDGTCVRLSTDAVRARYRDGLDRPVLVSTAEPLCYKFENFTFVSRVVKRGHRLRLVLAPLGFLGESPFNQRNLNSGGAVADETFAVAREVVVKLHHNNEWQSKLRIPVSRSQGHHAMVVSTKLR